MYEQMLPIGLLGKISCQNFKTRQFSNTAPAPWLIKESVYATMIGLNALSVWGNFKLSSSALYNRPFLAKNSAWNAPKIPQFRFMLQNTTPTKSKSRSKSAVN